MNVTAVINIVTVLFKGNKTQLELKKLCYKLMNCNRSALLYTDPPLWTQVSQGEGYSSRHLSGSWAPQACWGGRAWPLRTFWWWLHSAWALCAYVARWTGSWQKNKAKKGVNLSHMTLIQEWYEAFHDTKLVRGERCSFTHNFSILIWLCDQLGQYEM